MPVATSQLTITDDAAEPGRRAARRTPGVRRAARSTGLYVDSVNGTRPAGAAPRPIGCTQTNVFKRGEQFVLRAWGFELLDGAVLSIDNVTEAHFTVPGEPNVILNWGSHGRRGKVFFWTNFWNIPTDYPLGDIDRPGQLHARRPARPRRSTTRSRSSPSSHHTPEQRKRDETMSTKITTQRLALVAAVLAGALLLSAPAFGRARAADAARDPRRGRAARPARRARDAGGRHGHPHDEARHRPRRARRSRSPAPASPPNKDVSHRLEHRERHLGRRRPARQRRLPRPQGRQDQRRHRDDEDRRAGRVLDHAARRRRTSAASTTSTPSSTASRSRRAAS